MLDLRHPLDLNRRYSLEYLEICENALKTGRRELELKVAIKIDGVVQVEPVRVYASSDRYELFNAKGTTCVKCGTKGTHLRLRLTNYTKEGILRGHFNLHDDKGILMTKDHIIPRAKGGKNHLSNYQTMCEPCNIAKGTKIILEEVKQIGG